MNQKYQRGGMQNRVPPLVVQNLGYPPFGITMMYQRGGTIGTNVALPANLWKVLITTWKSFFYLWQLYSSRNKHFVKHFNFRDFRIWWILIISTFTARRVRLVLKSVLPLNSSDWRFWFKWCIRLLRAALRKLIFFSAHFSVKVQISSKFPYTRLSGAEMVIFFFISAVNRSHVKKNSAISAPESRV